MGRKSTFTVVTNRDNSTIVKMFMDKQEALDFVGPEYDKKGWLLTTFEKKTETFFSVVEDDDGEEDDSPLDPDHGKIPL